MLINNTDLPETDFPLTVTMPGMPHIWDSTGMAITRRGVLGALASYAVQQSPYTAPDDLTKAINEFSVAWAKVTHEADVVDFAITTEIRDFTCYDASTRAIERLVIEAFKQCPAIEKWNEKKDPEAPRDNADSDFIDLGALARNIAHDVTINERYSRAKA